MDATLKNRNDCINYAFTILWGPRCLLHFFLVIFFVLHEKSSNELKYMPKGHRKQVDMSKLKLAFARAAALGLDPAAEICRWYGIISCCLQRANAKILRGEPVPARHSAPPPRLFSLGRDLPLVGA